jgi:hypothetical protein
MKWTAKLDDARLAVRRTRDRLQKLPPASEKAVALRARLVTEMAALLALEGKSQRVHRPITIEG